MIDLAQVVDEFDIPVMCYGLKCLYVKEELFEGSMALLYWVDDISEIKSVCAYCKKATKMLYMIDGGVPNTRAKR